MAPLCACSRHRVTIGTRFSMEVPPEDVEEQQNIVRSIEDAFTTLGVRYLEVRVTSDDEKAGA